MLTLSSDAYITYWLARLSPPRQWVRALLFYLQWQTPLYLVTEHPNLWYSVDALWSNGTPHLSDGLMRATCQEAGVAPDTVSGIYIDATRKRPVRVTLYLCDGNQLAYEVR